MNKSESPNPLRSITIYGWLIRFLAAATTYIFGYVHVSQLYMGVLGPEAARFAGGTVTTLVIDVGSLVWYVLKVNGKAETEAQMEKANDASNILFWTSVSMSVAVMVLSIDLVSWPAWILSAAAWVGTVGTVGAIVLNFYTVDQFLKSGVAATQALDDARDRAKLRKALQSRLTAYRAERIPHLAEQLFNMGHSVDEARILDDIGGAGTSERLQIGSGNAQEPAGSQPSPTPSPTSLWESILSDDNPAREVADENTFRGSAD